MDMSFKLFSECGHVAPSRPGSGLAQSANRMAFDFATDVFEHIDIFDRTVARFNSIQNLEEPIATFTTWRALATGFMSIKNMDY